MIQQNFEFLECSQFIWNKKLREEKHQQTWVEDIAWTVYEVTKLVKVVRIEEVTTGEDDNDGNADDEKQDIQIRVVAKHFEDRIKKTGEIHDWKTESLVDVQETLSAKLIIDTLVQKISDK